MAIAPGGEPSAVKPLPRFETSFRPPEAAPGSVRRDRLIAILADPDGPPITTLFAPPGYGKTTLLATWAAEEQRPVAWLQLTDLDNDPARMLTYIIAAYAHVGPLPRSVTGPLPAGPDRLLAGPLPRLLAHLATWERPAILVLDDIHRITEQGALDLVSVLLDRLPTGFRVAVAGRSVPSLPFARLRAQRMLCEIGTRHLALDAAEAAELAQHAGVALDPQTARDLTARTEGWATGIYLAVLASAAGGKTPAPGHVSGSDEYIADYLRSEVGHGLAPDDLEFLIRTSVLETVTPGAALAVAGLDRPAERLDTLAAGNLLIRRMDGLPGTYRYHTTLREYLQGELARRGTVAVADLHTAAAAYHAAHGADEAAIEHAFAAGDHDAACRYLGAAIVPLWRAGQATLLFRWLAQLSPSDLEGRPMLAIGGAWIYILAGHQERAEMLADIADRVPAATLGASGREFLMAREVLRTSMGRYGAAETTERATVALGAAATPRTWRGAAAILLGVIHLGDPDGGRAADAFVEDALAVALPTAHGTRMAALAIRALVHVQSDRLDEAAAFATMARDVLADANDPGTLTALLVLAAAARTSALRGDLEEARESLVQAQFLRPVASHASPWLSVAALIELARAYLVLSDPGGAQTVIRQAEDIVRRRPGLGGYVDQLLRLRRQLANASDVLAGSSALTNAELRVLPLLPTYLTFEEIGERLNVSRNTVKTHAMSIYGKLWASSRSEAVERAVELGLLEPYPALARHGGSDAGS